jgi:hypothetical protein
MAVSAKQIVEYALVAGIAYETLVGSAEFAINSNLTTNSTIASIEQWPSIDSWLFQGNAAGLVDLGAAIVLLIVLIAVKVL